MTHPIPILAIAVVLLGCLAGVPQAFADDVLPAVAPAPRAAGPFGNLKALDTARLASSRGGTEVFNDMKLRGVVADNQASNLATGSNVITDGAFSGVTGLPMVIQNSGNNVLIQNATIINVQMN